MTYSDNKKNLVPSRYRHTIVEYTKLIPKNFLKKYKAPNCTISKKNLR